MMLSKFETYLESIGFKPFRSIAYKGMVPCTNLGFYSTMNGLDGRCFLHTLWVKDDVQITYGLNELHYPPILIHPRHRRIKNKDAVWTDILAKHTPERVFKSIIKFK